MSGRRTRWVADILGRARKYDSTLVVGVGVLIALLALLVDAIIRK